jgi:release factor glutamine methyltransferase
MQSLLEILNKTRDFFTQKGLENPRLEAELLIAGTLGMKRLELYLKFERPMTEPELAMLRERVKRRSAHEPLQYVLGNAQFRELTLKCDRRALIPRPETEELVELVLKRIPADKPVRLADLGTGTGAIALSLAHERPAAEVVACDYSADALALAKENAVACNLAGRVTFVRSDWLNAVSGNFDAIVSNPPYLTDDEVRVAEPEVRDHEPHSALIAPDAGLADLEKILRQAHPRLNAGGFVVLETGIAQHARLAELAKEIGYASSESFKDSSDFDRFFFANL